MLWELSGASAWWSLIIKLSPSEYQYLMSFLGALMISLSGSHTTVTDAPLFFTEGCQVPGRPVAIIAPDKRASTKERRVVNLLLIWQCNLIETINQGHYPLSLLLLFPA